MADNKPLAMVSAVVLFLLTAARALALAELVSEEATASKVPFMSVQATEARLPKPKLLTGMVKFPVQSSKMMKPIVGRACKRHKS
jgi:hypothetical protein